MTCPRRQRIRSIRAVRAFPRVILVIAAVAAAALMSGCVIRMPAVAPTSAPALGPSATADRPTGSDTVGCEGFGASMTTLLLTVRADAGGRPIEEWIAAYRVLAFSVGANALVELRAGRVVGGVRTLAVAPGAQLALALRADRPGEVRVESSALRFQVGPDSITRVAFSAPRRTGPRRVLGPDGATVLLLDVREPPGVRAP